MRPRRFVSPAWLLSAVAALAASAIACTDATDPSTLIFTAVSTGAGYTCGLTDDRIVYCWGANFDGQLGDGSKDSRSTPTRVSSRLQFASVSAFGDHTCALAENGDGYCWGANLHGQVGDGTEPTGEFPSRTKPTRVAGAVQLASIRVGSGHSCALTIAGTAYCWGNGGLGQRGDGSITVRVTSPTPVLGGLTFASLSLGHEHSCALTSDGSAYCWGANHRGEIGDSTTEHRSVPAPVLGGLSFASLAAGVTSTCGVLASGEAYCWGLVGLVDGGGVVSSLMPSPVSDKLRFFSISPGATHICGIGLDNTAYCWGRNPDGQLGVGDLDDRPTPTPVAGDLRFAQVSVGAVHTCGITLDGALYCWGLNLSGGLGDGTISSSDRPRWIAGPASSEQ
jgi:alpha-tubulin suppressor-like RCC1 family protein